VEKMTIYNHIGKTYNTTRHADTRIAQRIVQELDINTPATILDIGAGTGNYSYELANMGYRVIAMEPSEVMRTQGKQHRNIIWKEGVAESIPLEDGWRKPELYLNKDFQEGTSPLAKGRKEVVYECLNRLRTDLENGDWHKKYGDILQLNEYECGHFFLLV
jgi:SAM-dependent methyltransferase